MKKLYFLIIGLLLLTIVNSQTIVTSGNVSGNWTLSNSPYIIQGDIIIPDSQLLVIEPGVRVEFEGYYGLNVFGKLSSIGNNIDTIVFTSADTTGIYLNDSLGRWKGILIDMESNIDTTIIDYSSIQYTFAKFDTSDNWLNFIGAINICEYNNVVISNSYISDNFLNNMTQFVTMGAIMATNCNPTIVSNIITNNINYSGLNINNCLNSIVKGNEISYNTSISGAGIYLFSSLSSIEDNFIHHNHACGDVTGGGGIKVYLCQNVNTQIKNNKITFNSAEEAGAGIYFNNSKGSITGNLIANNYTFEGSCGFSDGGGGIFVSQTYNNSLLIQNNIIVNNNSDHDGGGLKFVRSKVTVSNNVISNNTSNSFGGGIGLLEDSSSFYNNIITQNYKNNIHENLSFFGTADSTTWRNNLFDTLSVNRVDTITSIIDTLNCIVANPEFILPSAGAGVGYDGASGYWNVFTTSVAINNGIIDTTGLNLILVDYANNSRIQGGRIDIGAYESLIVNIKDNIGKNETLIYPNPTTGKLIIVSDKTIEQVNITDINGKTVYTTSLRGTKQSISLDLSKQAKGIYFVKLIGDGFVSVQKLVLE